MSLTVIPSGLKPLQLAFNALKISVTGTAAQERNRNRYIWPKKRYPEWYLKQERTMVQSPDRAEINRKVFKYEATNENAYVYIMRSVQYIGMYLYLYKDKETNPLTKYKQDLTPENEEFLNQVVCDKYGPLGEVCGVQTYLHSPLKKEPILRGQWFPNCRRSGLIGIKLGETRQWLNDGKPCITTLIQIVDNHVIKYIPPEEFVVNKKKYARKFYKEGKLGCLVVGSVNCDPQLFTKEYNGLFAAAGVMPKKLLTRFPIHPCAAIQPGTPLYAAHFKIGDVLDVSGISVDRGFQGVMKRWGFHGQPASHGATKTHRRPGNIGGTKARVWPGTKMPGCVGNRLRVAKGVKILRIDHKYNVIYVTGRGIPGKVNSFLYLHDTILPLRRLKESPRFPTYYPEDFVDNPLPDEEFDSNLFNFSNPSIIFKEEKIKKK